MWGLVYQATGVSPGPLSGATMKVWKDGSNYKLNISNDPIYNGDYYKSTILNPGGTPFELIKFDPIGGTVFYYKPGTEDGIVYVSGSGIAVVED